MTGGFNLTERIQTVTKKLADVNAEMAWEAAGTAADVAGMVDPTPISDAVGAGIAIRNGDFLGAGLNVVGMIPYLGDAVAKPIKATRVAKRVLALKEKATLLTKELADLNALKKKEEAAELAAKEVKISADAKKVKDAEKATAEQEKAIAKAKDKDCEDCSKASTPPQATNQSGAVPPTQVTNAIANPLRAGQLHEAEQLAALGIGKNNEVFRPSIEQTQSATFKAIVGDPKYTKGGQLKGTIFDGVDNGYLEIKGGASELNSTYQLRLQTYKATIDRQPFSIQTTRPLNPQFKDYLDAWGVNVIKPK